MKARFAPGTPSRRSTVRLVSFGSSRYTVERSELPTGRGAPSAKRRATSALGSRGLEEQARASRAAGLQIHHRADVPRGRVVQERLGAAQPRLLGVVHEQEDVGRGGLGPERPGDLEGDGHARAVVGSSWPGRNRVEVGGDEHRRASSAARQAGQDVGDRRAGEVAIADHRLRDPWLHSDGPELGDDPLAHSRVRLRSEPGGGRPRRPPRAPVADPGELARRRRRQRERRRGAGTEAATRARSRRGPPRGGGVRRRRRAPASGAILSRHRRRDGRRRKRRAGPGQRVPRTGPCCAQCSCFATSPGPRCSGPSCPASTGC